MDHHAPAETLLNIGWILALLGAGIAGGLAGLLGAGPLSLLAVGLVAFGVFGVLLGKGGVELTAAGDHDHSHGDHH